MEFPARIREKIEELIKNEDIRRLSETAERLSENYRRGERFSASSKREILAYSAVRMPATFGAVSRALELALDDFDGEIKSVLDAGAGTGAAAIAAEMITGCSEMTCLERDGNMTELGRLFAENARWIKRDIMDGITEKAELVICSYCLNELPENFRNSVTASLAAACEKLLLIVEPGTPKAFSNLKKIRGELAALGMKIIAPCPADGGCPLPENDWCHFTARVARSRLHKQLKKADVPYEDEKFCFIAAVWENDPERTPEISGEKYARILRRPVIAPGRITLKLCSENGTEERTITRSSPLFKQARKSETGDKFPLYTPFYCKSQK